MVTEATIDYLHLIKASTIMANVIDAGVIVESGAHEDLINKNGIYKELWAHQSGTESRG